MTNATTHEGPPMPSQEIVSPKTSSVDFLTDRLITAYFEAREHESYYNSLRYVNVRRDFHETIIPVLIDFIGEALSNPNTSALDEVLEAAATARTIIGPTPDVSVVQEARRLDPVGFSLLGIGETLTLATLKSQYRQAARTHHPDAGGSNDIMIKVNNAYTLFHELLCQRRFIITDSPQKEQSGTTGYEAPIRTAKDYVYVAGFLLLEIKRDEWALDNAHYWLTILCSNEWMGSAYARHTSMCFKRFFACDSLAGVLWAAGRKEQAQEVARISPKK